MGTSERRGLKPGWCILHGLPEPCWKCNSPRSRGLRSCVDDTAAGAPVQGGAS